MSWRAFATPEFLSMWRNPGARIDLEDPALRLESTPRHHAIGIGRLLQRVTPVLASSSRVGARGRVLRDFERNVRR
jgi:hypothetical protein